MNCRMPYPDFLTQRTIPKKGLRLRLHQGNQRTWDRFLPELLVGLRRIRNAATNVTPSHLLFGKTIARPGDWRFTHLFPPEESEEHSQREEEARQHQATYQARYGTTPSKPRFNVGDWIYTDSHRLSNKSQGFNAKFAESKVGPYQILENISVDVY